MTGYQLRRIRKKLDLSIRDLAERWGVGKSTLQREEDKNEVRGVYADAARYLSSNSSTMTETTNIFEEAQDHPTVRTGEEAALLAAEDGHALAESSAGWMLIEEGVLFWIERSGPYFDDVTYAVQALDPNGVLVNEDEVAYLIERLYRGDDDIHIDAGGVYEGDWNAIADQLDLPTEADEFGVEHYDV